METPQSVGGTQNSREKAENKKPWKVIGIVLALLILLIIFKMENLALILMLISFACFLLSLFYPNAQVIFGSKSKSSIRLTFGLLTIAFFVAFGITSDKKEEVAKNNSPSNPPQVQEAAEQSKPAPTPPSAPQFTFDVPSLIGKNIDEVVAALGKPTTDKEPTKQQLNLGIDNWDKEFTKDEVGLLVTYNPKSKVVSDFFIDGENKSTLLLQGNLQENNNVYSIEFVKNIIDPNKITGVKVSKKLPEEMDASVTFSTNAFKIENKEDYGWTKCKFELNGGGKIFSGGYEFTSSSGIKAKDSLIIPFSDFTKDSQRFNFLLEKPKNLFMACDTNGQHRTNYFTIN